MCLCVRCDLYKCVIFRINLTITILWGKWFLKLSANINDLARKTRQNTRAAWINKNTCGKCHREIIVSNKERGCGHCVMQTGNTLPFNFSAFFPSLAHFQILLNIYRIVFVIFCISYCQFWAFILLCDSVQNTSESMSKRNETACRVYSISI